MVRVTKILLETKNNEQFRTHTLRFYGRWKPKNGGDTADFALKNLHQFQTLIERGKRLFFLFLDLQNGLEASGMI